MNFYRKKYHRTPQPANFLLFYKSLYFFQSLYVFSQTLPKEKYGKTINSLKMR